MLFSIKQSISLLCFAFFALNASFAFPQPTRRLIFIFKVLEIFICLFEVSAHYYNQIQVLLMLFSIKQSANK